MMVCKSLSNRSGLSSSTSPHTQGRIFAQPKRHFQRYPLPDHLMGAMVKVPAQGDTHLTLKQVSLAIPNLTMYASSNWTASRVVTGHLVTDIRGRIEFNTGDNSLLLRQGCRYIRCYNVHTKQAILKETMSASPDLEACRLRQETKTGTCITVLPSIVYRTELGIRNGAMLYSYATAQRPQTSLPNVMVETPHSIYSTNCTVRRASSSRLVIKSSVTELPTSQANTLPPRTCAVTP